MQNKKFKLTWPMHTDFQRKVMKDMMTSADSFTDVTLFSDDKIPIKAHKNILSAFSPVLRSILQTMENSSHALIFLRGINHQEIEAILQFIYSGESILFEERIQELLLVAKSLEIQELSSNVEVFQSQNSKKQLQNVIDQPQLEEYDSNQVENSQSPKNVVFDQSKDLHEIQDQDDPEADQGTGEAEGLFNSHDLKKQFQDKEIPEVVRIGSKFQCSTCQSKFSCKSSARAHILSKHEGKLYGCTQCQQQFTAKSHMIRHIKSLHESFKYFCNKCDYECKAEWNLKVHIQSVHEGVTFDCSECDYQGTAKKNLKRHIQFVHQGSIGMYNHNS